MNMNNKIRRTLCLITAASIVSPTQLAVNAFIQPSTDQCSIITSSSSSSSSSSSTSMGMSIISNNKDNGIPQHTVPTSTDDDESILPMIMDAVDSDSELSEFLGRNLIPGIGTHSGTTSVTGTGTRTGTSASDTPSGKANTNEHSEFPLLMSTSDEQKEFELKLGKALDT